MDRNKIGARVCINIELVVALHAVVVEHYQTPRDSPGRQHRGRQRTALVARSTTIMAAAAAACRSLGLFLAVLAVSFSGKQHAAILMF